MNKITHSIEPAELKIGEFFTRTEENGVEETYLLSKINVHFALICLNDGELWSKAALKIADAFGSNEQKKQFQLVTKPFTITPDV